MTKHLLGFLLLSTLTSCNLLEAQPPRQNVNDLTEDMRDDKKDVGNDLPNIANDVAVREEDTSADVATACADGSECQSGVCEDSRCIEATCSDGIKNGDESDVDCSGSCDLCSTGEVCRKNADCDGGACTNGECRPTSCGDDLKNGNESDLDCGGDCAPCSAGLDCAANSDCESKVCGRTTCSVPRCGDSIVNGADEECDKGTFDTATCNSDCTIPLCGDGIVNPVAGESCDDGNTLTEACDFGLMSCMVCADDCKTRAGVSSFCGDAMVQANNEVCDDGTNDGSPGSCVADCSAAVVCGDTIVSGIEVCDDGTNNGAPGSCVADCSAAVVCGDNIVNGTETCDDGNAVTEVCKYASMSCVVCNAMCVNVPGMTSYCGDNSTDAGNGEQCDDGNLINGDGCDSSCQIEIGECFDANGLTWCRDINAADQSCNSICMNSGARPANEVTTFEAQDTIVECTKIRDVFGMTNVVTMGNYAVACAQYNNTNILCSTRPDCPLAARTASDPLYISICACEFP